MKVSLVMAVYNGEKYLIEQLDSIRKQTYLIDEVILIDITFPFDILQELGRITKLTVIDHHISFKKQVDNHLQIGHDIVTCDLKYITFEYIYDDKLSACELGFKHYFGYIPPIVELVGKYDTWRANGTDEWDKHVLPVKYFLLTLQHFWILKDNATL